MTDETAKLNPLPVAGYAPQSKIAIEMIVNGHKQFEETILKHLDILKENPETDQRWLAIGRTSLEQAFMAINRSVFKPQRLS